jgi:hypothetical protein
MCVEESATSRKERLHCRDATKCKASCTNGQGIGTSCNADFNSTDHNHTPCLNKELILETKKARKILSWVVDSIIGAEAVATCHLEMTEVYADGTFKIASDLFLQVYTIHCVVEGRCLPMIYCILWLQASASGVLPILRKILRRRLRSTQKEAK